MILPTTRCNSGPLMLFFVLLLPSFAILSSASRLSGCRSIRRKMMQGGAYLDSISFDKTQHEEVQLVTRSPVSAGSVLFALPARQLLSCFDVAIPEALVDSEADPVGICKMALATMFAESRCTAPNTMLNTTYVSIESSSSIPALQNWSNTSVFLIQKYMHSLPASDSQFPLSRVIGRQNESKASPEEALQFHMLQPWLGAHKSAYEQLLVAVRGALGRVCGGAHEVEPHLRWAYHMVTSRSFHLGDMDTRPWCASESHIGAEGQGNGRYTSQPGTGTRAGPCFPLPRGSSSDAGEDGHVPILDFRRCYPPFQSSEDVHGVEEMPPWCQWARNPPPVAMAPVLDLMDHGEGEAAIREGDIQLGTVPVNQALVQGGTPGGRRELPGFANLLLPPRQLLPAESMQDPSTSSEVAVERELIVFASARASMPQGTPIHLQYAAGACVQEAMVLYGFLPDLDLQSSKSIESGSTSSSFQGCITVEISSSGWSDEGVLKALTIDGVVRSADSGTELQLVLEEHSNASMQEHPLLQMAAIASKQSAENSREKNATISTVPGPGESNGFQDLGRLIALAGDWVSQSIERAKVCADRAAGGQHVGNGDLARLSSYILRAGNAWEVRLETWRANEAENKHRQRRRRP